jgi:hypothetical protein
VQQPFLAEWTILNALRDALRINSGILFLFVNRENLRIFPIYFFTGRDAAVDRRFPFTTSPVKMG